MDRTVFGEQNPKVADLFCNKPSPNGILVCGRPKDHDKTPDDVYLGWKSPCGEWM